MEWIYAERDRQFVWLPHKHAWLNLDHVVCAEYETGQANERMRVCTTGSHRLYLVGEDAEILDAALDMRGARETEAAK